MRQIFFIGNEGVGKSTLLNSLLAELHFTTSANAVGSSSTRALPHVDHNKVRYFDTPGLSDRLSRRSTATHIAHALLPGGQFTLVFVVTLDWDSGLVRPDDMDLINTVMRTVQPIISKSQPSPRVSESPKVSYSVIVNKCDMPTMERMSMTDTNSDPEKENEAMYALRSSLSSDHLWPLGGILLFPMISSLVNANADDLLLAKPMQLVRFLENSDECPTLILEPPTPLRSSRNGKQNEAFDTRMDEFSALLNILKSEISGIKSSDSPEDVTAGDLTQKLLLTSLQGVTSGLSDGSCVQELLTGSKPAAEPASENSSSVLSSLWSLGQKELF